MDRYRKMLISILTMLVLSAVIAIVDISMGLQSGARRTGVGSPQFGPGVGVVRIEGPIHMSNPAGSLVMNASAEQIVKRIDSLSKNGSIRAILVRIDSPGGTVAASQEIYQKLMKVRKKKIPLVASMGDVAASGGYYIASACDYIVANQGTITGSIGVIAMSPGLKGLFDRLGIDMRIVKSGRYKDMMSFARDIAPDEREILQRLIDNSYRRFVSDVARGRSMSETDILKFADGRIFDGESALALKLVDALGNFEDAADKARGLAELSKDAPVYDDEKSPLQQIFMSMESIMKGRGFTGALNERGADFPYRLEYLYRP